jgi:hypothetical protein
MKTTTQKPQKKSSRPTQAEIKRLLQEARKKNAKLEEAGILPHPTKSWSAKSVKTLSKALGGGA